MNTSTARKPWTLYSPRQRWTYLAILFLVSTSNYVDRNVISVLLEPIKAEFQVSDTMLGLLTGISFALFYATLGIPVARWADRGDRRFIITASLTIWSAMTSLCGMAQSFWQLALARVGVGAGEAGAIPPAQSLIADYFDPAQRGRALAIFMASAMVGYLIGFVFGAQIAAAYGWRWAFIVMGLPGLALAAVVRVALREPRHLPEFRKGGSMHIVDMSLGILGANGVVAGGLGIAAGAALSAKVEGEKRISVAFFGDGALNEGLFYETANMASLWKLPLVYVMENNQYGEYTATSRSTAGSGPARAEAMGIPAKKVDGNDVLAVYEAAHWAVQRARSGEGPSFIECITYRWRGHHMGDQGDTYGYRTQAEVEEWMKHCPLIRYRNYIIQNEIAPAEGLDAIEIDIQAQIDQAVEFAKDAAYTDPEEVYKDVYA